MIKLQQQSEKQSGGTPRGVIQPGARLTIATKSGKEREGNLAMIKTKRITTREHEESIRKEI